MKMKKYSYQGSDYNEQRSVHFNSFIAYGRLLHSKTIRNVY